MKYLYTPLFSLLIASQLILIGCTNARDASDNNFKAAINAYLEQKNPICYVVSASPLPIELRDDGQSSNGSKMQMDALTTAGMLKSEPITIQPLFEHHFTPSTELNKKSTELNKKTDQPNKKPHPGTRYSLTNAGEKSYRLNMPSSSDWPQGGVGICFGTAEVANIESYSDPKIGEGGMLSTVKFKYKVKEATDWANNPALVNSFPEYAKAQAGDASMELKLKRGVEQWEVVE